MAEVLRAFDAEQLATVAHLLALKTRALRNTPGAMMEEYHWADIYLSAKGIPESARRTWSNLAFNDLVHEGFGVEWKLLKRLKPSADRGRVLMHPAATRKLRFDPTHPADDCKNLVLEQWGNGIREFHRRVARTSPDARSADIRFGILLWSSVFDEFLYFEERLAPPDPSAFRGMWVTGRSRGQPTRNLGIFDATTGVKRYSVTLPENGAKLQPYFDVPTESQGGHLFRVRSELLKPLWVTPQTYEALGARDDSDHDEIIRRLLERS